MAFVRTASGTSDAGDLATLQERVFAEKYGHLPAVAAHLEQRSSEGDWRELLSAADVSVVVAVTHGIVGYLIWTMDGDVAQIHALEIDPDARGQGHATRLLTAFADLSAPAVTAIMWCPIEDDAMRGLLHTCGWGPDGSLRELQSADGHTLREVRLVTDLGPYRSPPPTSGESPAPAG